MSAPVTSLSLKIISFNFKATSSIALSGAYCESSSTLIVLNALVANKTSTSANVDVYMVPNSGDSVYLLKSVPVPAGSSLELITGSKIILESSDVLRGRADTASALDLTVSYLDQT